MCVCGVGGGGGEGGGEGREREREIIFVMLMLNRLMKEIPICHVKLTNKLIVTGAQLFCEYQKVEKLSHNSH